MIPLNLIFDEDAEGYQRARPGYPDVLIDDLVAGTGLRAGDRVIEIGPGTGQATRSLTSRGLSVIGVGPGANLARVLSDTVSGDLQVVVSAFEDLPVPDPLVDAVMAFTSWHWLAVPARAAKARACLRPGGALATVTTHHVEGGTADFFRQAQACYRRWDVTSPDDHRLPSADTVPPTSDEIDTDAAFEAPTHRRYIAELTYSAGEYCDLLDTYSGHRAMPREQHQGLLDCLADLIDSCYGGHIVKPYLYDVRTARRR